MNPSEKTPSSRLERLAESTWLLFLPFLLFSPSLFVGFVADDLFHLMILEQTIEDSNPLHTLFGFFPTDQDVRAQLRDWGMFNWWAHPDMRVHFFRPLSALTHMLDHAIWPNTPLLQHVHSLLWMCLTCWAIRRLYKTTGNAGLALSFALLLFVVEDAHAMAAGWMANRNLLIAGVFGILAVDAHIKWRRKEGGITASVLWMTLALLAAEAGICAFGYILAWALCHEKKWADVFKSILPVVLLILCWRIPYSLADYGEWGTGLYTDPLSTPFGFVLDVLERIPVLMFAQWFQCPIDAWMLMSFSLRMLLCGAGAVFLIGLGFVFKSLLKENRQARFWTLGMLFSAIPLCAAMPMDRLLFFPGIGACALLGMHLARLESPWKSFLLWIHIPFAILLCLGRSFGLHFFSQAMLIAAQGAPKDIGPDQDLIFINGTALPVAYAKIVPTQKRSPFTPKSVELLAHATQGAVVTRKGEHSLEITAESGWFSLPVEQMLRDPRLPTPIGAVYETPRFKARILELTPDKRPKKMLFTFTKKLDDPGLRWMCMKDLEFAECAPPKQGVTLDLPGLMP